MGMENDVMLSYLGDNERFADTFNFGFFNGKQVVQADDLAETSEIYRPSIRESYYAAKQKAAEESAKAGKSTESNALSSTGTTSGKKKKQKAKKQPSTRTRDIIKTLHTGQSLKIVAIESQSDVNYLMPWRIMNYDDKEYEKQIDKIIDQHEDAINEGLKVYHNNAERLSQFRADDRLNPVYTLCVYHGTKPWDGPRSLKDLMDFGTENPELWEQIFADYPMRIICLNEIQDFSDFHSSVKYLFSLLPHRKDKDKAWDMIANDSSYHTMDGETADAVSCLMDIDIFIKNPEKYKTEGGYNMCQAMQELRADWRAEGRALTIKVSKFMQANPDADDKTIAAACDCTINDVTEIRNAWGV